MAKIIITAASTFILLESVERAFGLRTGLVVAGGIVVAGALCLLLTRSPSARQERW